MGNIPLFFPDRVDSGGGPTHWRFQKLVGATFYELDGFSFELGRELFACTHVTPPSGILPPFQDVCQIQATTARPYEISSQGRGRIWTSLHLIDMRKAFGYSACY